MYTTKSWTTGALFILLASVTFSFQPIFANLIYAAGANPAGLLWMRFLASAVCLLVILKLQKKSINNLCWSSLGLGVGYALVALCYFSTLQYASTSLAVILLYLFPIIVMVLASIFFKEQLSKVKILTLSLALIGVLLAVGLNPQGSFLGILFGLASALSYALYVLLCNHFLSAKDIFNSTTYIFIGAAITYTIAALFTENVALPQATNGWLALAGLVIFSTVIPIIALNQGNIIIGASDTAILSTLEPIVTIILAVIVLNEELTAMRVTGGLLVMVAVMVISRQQRLPAN